MTLIRLLLTGIVIFVLLTPSWARKIRSMAPSRLDPIYQAIQAEIVVVGRIVEIEDGVIEVTTHPSTPQKMLYKVANIQIDEALVGAKGLTHIRMGFLPGNQPLNSNNPIDFDVGESPQTDSYGIHEGGCFFLQKHPQENFYIPLQYGNRLDSRQDKYEGTLGQIKRMLEVYQKPLEALQAKKSEDREFAAWALLKKYKSSPMNTANLQEVEIPKEESNLILKVMSEMENNPSNPDSPAYFTSLFHLLRITNQDGWRDPKLDEKADNTKLIKDAFDKWYKTHGEKYRIKKWVTPKK